MVAFPGSVADQNASSITVLSYNARYFRAQNTYKKFSFNLIEWVVNDPSDIKCIQEFSTNDEWSELDIRKRISDKGYHSNVYVATEIDRDHNPGLAIFSKYPIIDSGYVWNDPTTSNGAIYADIRVDDQVIRIYNVHLASMDLISGFFRMYFFYTFKMLKRGSEKRENQIKALIRHAKDSPFPFIISGDFNEIPYGYNYRMLNNNLNNTFNEVGAGFGITYRYLPVRIDYLFHHNHISPLEFRVEDSVRFSDHYPLFARYIVGDK